jgi:hypothetical protein
MEEKELKNHGERLPAVPHPVETPISTKMRSGIISS